MEIISLGDSALVIRLSENFARNPESVLRAVHHLEQSLQRARIPGIAETAPAYASLGVFLDPTAAVDAGAPPNDYLPWIAARIQAALALSVNVIADETDTSIIEIPVCYEADFAPDLDEVARHAGLSPNEVIQRHSATDYWVHCLGFTPGFPYLGGLPVELATPRRAIPRKEIPAGSVAIGGQQTGIYPTSSPGGWNIIGRTPLHLFDPTRQPPALLAAGMRVHFHAITRAEFDSLGQ